MHDPVVAFGKHRGQPVSKIPAGWLKWALPNCDRLTLSECEAIKLELTRRGKRFVDAAPVLAEAEEALVERLGDSDDLCHECAGQVCDEVMDVFEQIRTRHGIAEGVRE